MNRLPLALGVLLIASLGTTGCSYSYGYRYRARHARGYYAMHVRAPVYYGPAPAAVVPVPAAEEVAPPAPAVPAAPPAPAVPVTPAAQAGPGTVYVHVHVPGTTVIVVNPPAGAPAVQQQVEAPQAPQAPAVPRQPAPQQERPEGWFEDD